MQISKVLDNAKNENYATCISPLTYNKDPMEESATWTQAPLRPRHAKVALKGRPSVNGTYTQ